MSDKIRHQGIVEQLEGDHVTVRIGQTSACAACQLNGHCNASESREKLIEAHRPPDRDLKVGDAVTVSTDLQTGYRAVAWGFGLPLILLVAVIAAVKVISGSEGTAALAGLLALTPYYIVVYLLRHRLARKIRFEVE